MQVMLKPAIGEGKNMARSRCGCLALDGTCGRAHCIPEPLLVMQS